MPVFFQMPFFVMLQFYTDNYSCSTETAIKKIVAFFPHPESLLLSVQLPESGSKDKNFSSAKYNQF